MHPPREDYAGADWLITNRGIAKRAVFETRQDVARFLEALAEVVALGILEVHAYVFLTTHFHLLVTSPTGEISRAMKLVTNAFVRWLNRSRKRDGPLFATRFHGRRIDDGEHWLAALRYIDLNPVRAGMERVPSDHPHGSARAYRYETGPDWLSRRRAIGAVTDLLFPAPYDPSRYDEFACSADERANAYLIEHLSRFPDRPAPPLTDLIRTASLRQQGWMEWKAALADGMQIGTAFLPPAAALRAARAAERLLSRDPPRGVARTLSRDVSVGLLRDAAGQQITEIADELQLARSTVSRALARHDAWMRDAARYHDAVARALQGAVRRTFGPRRHALALPVRIASVGPEVDPGVAQRVATTRWNDRSLESNGAERRAN